MLCPRDGPGHPPPSPRLQETRGPCIAEVAEEYNRAEEGEPVSAVVVLSLRIGVRRAD